ncbi:MAG: class I SAM-dependent methyltransferase [Tepidiformaceae bacterium]
MLKRMPPERADELIAAASRFPTSDPGVSYPAWYLHRWHFLPEGYLSRRSAAGYDNVIRHLYNQGLESRVIAAVVEKVRSFAPASVLEAGSGPGHLLNALADGEDTSELVGVELSPYLLARAKRRLQGRSVRLVHGNGLAIPADAGSFDLALASHYVGHLPQRVRAKAVAELARIVRPGGHVLTIEHRWHPWPATDALELIQRAKLTLGFIALSVFERTNEAARATS